MNMLRKGNGTISRRDRTVRETTIDVGKGYHLTLEELRKLVDSVHDYGDDATLFFTSSHGTTVNEMQSVRVTDVETLDSGRRA